MNNNHRTQILLRHSGNPIEYRTPNDEWLPTKWDNYLSRIEAWPGMFRLPVYSLEDITDEHLSLLGFSDRILDKIHCDKNGSFWYRKDSDAKLIDKANVWEANEIDKLRSLGYATSHTLVIPKPETEDFYFKSDDLNKDEADYEQALKEWQPTKTYSVDELIKEGVFQIIKR